MKRQKKAKLSSVQIIALGFFIMILLGTGLLMLPIASVEPGGASFGDALFTATSASCVTGLVQQDTGTYWTTFGQMVIIVLIQIGGLGFMTIATLFLLLLRRRMGLRQREVVVEGISYNQLGGFAPFIRRVFLGTLLIEGLGAVLLSVRFAGEMGLRNKKVSDEVIGKIHDAYPSLSVLWLMFGEGSMVPDANNEISEHENDLFSASQAAESNDNEEFALDSDFMQSEVPQMPEKIEESANSIKRPIRKENNIADTVQPAPQASMSLNFDNTKKIVNIMVFYNDNSFEWFVPKS